jgi:hypothetical protein
MRNMLPTSAATELPNIVQQLQEHVLALSNENNVLTTRLGTLQTTTGDILTILRAMQTDVKTITTSVEVSVVGDTPKRKKSTHYYVSQPSSQESVLGSTSLEEQALVSQSGKYKMYTCTLCMVLMYIMYVVYTLCMFLIYIMYIFDT